jgi:choline-sulfatase
MKKANIIFILSDQHNKKVMGNAGDPFIKTPNLDWLASEGTSLKNCYCGSPLCVPSRSSILSGLLPSNTGVFNNMQCLRSDEATFVHSLAIAGYETVLCGRMHFNGPDQRHGFEKRFVGDITPSFPGRKNEVYGCLEGTTGQNAIAIEKSGPGHSNVLSFDDDVLSSACNYLEERKDERSLFMTVGFYGPHCPYVCPKELFDYYYNLLPEPNMLNEDEKKKLHPAVKKWIKNRGIERVTAEDIKRVRASYYGMVTYLDTQIGVLMEKIKKTVGLENTLIIYASDHGDNIGYHTLFWKTNFYEEAVSVPVIFSYPGHIEKGKSITELTSLLDFAPTLINFCNGPALPKYNGEDIYPTLQGGDTINNDRCIISQLGDVKGDNPSAMIRKGDWKLVSHYGYKNPQLFNLNEDPYESTDLSNDERFNHIMEELLKELSLYWDGETVNELVQTSISKIRILKQWTKETNLEGIEEWQGDADNNYIRYN